MLSHVLDISTFIVYFWCFWIPFLLTSLVRQNKNSIFYDLYLALLKSKYESSSGLYDMSQSNIKIGFPAKNVIVSIMYPKYDQVKVSTSLESSASFTGWYVRGDVKNKTSDTSRKDNFFCWDYAYIIIFSFFFLIAKHFGIRLVKYPKS